MSEDQNISTENYWLSLEQYFNDPEFLQRAEQEFQSSPLREEAGEDQKKNGIARREFLKLMGASIALASSGCIRRPVQRIIPYNKQPEQVTFDVPSEYTSTWFDGSEGFGLLVKSKEGRPIKVEGNPKFIHLNGGAISARAQAHILSLYDPERVRTPQKKLGGAVSTTSWDEVDATVVEQLKKKNIALLTGPMLSPTERSIFKESSELMGLQHYIWQGITQEVIEEARQKLGGAHLVPQYRFDKAQLIVSIDADFLGTWLKPVTFTRQFSQGRKNFKQRNKLIVFDSYYSLTGANADIRMKIKPSQQIDVALGLAFELVTQKGKALAGVSSDRLKEILAPYKGTASRLGFEEQFWNQLVSELAQQSGRSLVVAGGLPTQTAQALELQLAVSLINELLGNEGFTIESSHSQFESSIWNESASNNKSDNKSAKNLQIYGSYKELMNLIAQMNQGNVKTLIIHQCNPLYVLPKSFGFEEALKKVEMVIVLSDRWDETAQNANYLLPVNHSMETWLDVELTPGVYSIHQPTIRPLYESRSLLGNWLKWSKALELKSHWTGENEYECIRQFYKEKIFPHLRQQDKSTAFEDSWWELLQKGFVEIKTSEPTIHQKKKITFSEEVLHQMTQKTVEQRISLDKNKANAQNKTADPFSVPLELVLYSKVSLGDGSLSNVPWLHELPDPVTKITWDNYAQVSPQKARELNLNEGDIVEIKMNNGTVLPLPIHIQPGLHSEVVAVAVGYGRTDAGKVGSHIGQNAYIFLNPLSSGSILASGQMVELKKTGKKDKLACVQDHHSMEGRKIVAESSLKDYLNNPSSGNHSHKVWSIWSGHQYNGNKWAMAVDLNACTGCSACMVACQSENNIPVVGKKYVIEGREMHWIRLDRYYVGDPMNEKSSVNVVFQPVMCQHCDNAPCETVCPVMATVHTSDGLNSMVYNRCVGTKYCANNCPYKVRRFNWFHYTKEVKKPLNLAYNPEVTVRSRGVMEKCSFCIQRIQAARSRVRVQKRELIDGDIQPACQQSCPAEALIFGDMNDPESRVSKLFKDPRSYGLLEEFNAAPNVRYLTKIRNNDQGGNPV